MHRILALAATLWLVPALARASAPAPSPSPVSQPASNDATFNYGLSSFLGSGIYTFSGQNVQLYRIPFRLRLDDHAAREPEFYAVLPVTYGFYNFSPTDVLHGDVPRSVDTLSVLAGIEGRWWLSEEWRYLQLGAVGYTRAAGHPDKRLIGTQAAIEHYAPWGPWSTRVRTELLGALSAGGPDGTDRVLRLLEGVELDHPQSWEVFGRQAAVGVYGVVRWYPGAFAYTTTQTPIRLEAEAGVTFGTVEPLRVWSLPLPRLSLGYRRAASLNVFFLGFGTPF